MVQQVSHRGEAKAEGQKSKIGISVENVLPSFNCRPQGEGWRRYCFHRCVSVQRAGGTPY